LLTLTPQICNRQPRVWFFSFSSFPSGGCLVRAIGSQHSLRQKKKNVVISEFLDQIELFYRSDFWTFGTNYFVWWTARLHYITHRAVAVRESWQSGAGQRVEWVNNFHNSFTSK
jgi:hypothetical protein